MDLCTHGEPAPGCGLLRDLRLTHAGQRQYTGMTRSGRSSPGRSYGGGIVAQALLAAGETVPGSQAPGSLHAYFVTAGDATRPLRYTVSDIGEGPSWALRQVTADQDGTVRLTMTASFRRFYGEQGSSHQRPAPSGALTEPPALTWADASCDCPDDRLGAGTPHIPPCGILLAGAPEQALPGQDGPGQYGPGQHHRGPDHLGPDRPETGSAPGAHRATWMCVGHDLGESPLWHAALLAYMSDMGTLSVVDQPHASEPGVRRAASVDHSIWFHRPFRADDWHWYGQRSPILTGGRGTFEGSFYNTAGQLVASVAQEASLRRVLTRLGSRIPSLPQRQPRT
jgi:acyl-CoA thioesterase-2